MSVTTPVFLLAHSLGSQIAMNYAVNSPKRVAGLMLLNPAPVHGIHRMIRPYWLIKLVT